MKIFKNIILRDQYTGYGGGGGGSSTPSEAQQSTVNSVIEVPPKLEVPKFI